MNAVRDFRVAVAARLVAQVAALDVEDVIVERNGSLTEQLAETVAKASAGIAVTIGPGAGRNIDPEGGALNMEVVYEITLWVLPIYYDGTFPEDALFIPMMQALHGESIHAADDKWLPYEAQVMSFRDVPDQDYLAMSFQLRRRLML